MQMQPFVETDQMNQFQAPGWMRYWLWLLVGLVIVMVALGGATRLTGSGLSMTEWRPLTGAIPPLSDAAWLVEFDKYQHSSQYEVLNYGMSMDEFKSIYWWEWSHRQFGRATGLVFLVPFLLLVRGWRRGTVSRAVMGWLLGICMLGGLQAAVGWIMVASGLRPGMVAVAPVKLMLHLLVAACILAALVRFLAKLSSSDPIRLAPGLVFWSKWIPVVFLVQMALGALVAGSKAGFAYNTWPLMSGRFIPSFGDLFVFSPWYENFFANATMVQFQHRMVAYVVAVLAVFYAVTVWRSHPRTRGARHALVLLVLVGMQVLLGIVTLLSHVPLWAALAHQVLAMVIFVAGCHHASRVRA